MQGERTDQGGKETAAVAGRPDIGIDSVRRAVGALDLERTGEAADAGVGQLLRQVGITWTAAGFPPAGPSTPRILAEVNSPVLDSVASEVNRRSLNIGAELLLQWRPAAAHRRRKR